MHCYGERLAIQRGMDSRLALTSHTFEGLSNTGMSLSANVGLASIVSGNIPIFPASARRNPVIGENAENQRKMAKPNQIRMLLLFAGHLAASWKDGAAPARRSFGAVISNLGRRAKHPSLRILRIDYRLAQVRPGVLHIVDSLAHAPCFHLVSVEGA